MKEIKDNLTTEKINLERKITEIQLQSDKEIYNLNVIMKKKNNLLQYKTTNFILNYFILFFFLI